jgi:hypothetical protein
LEKAPSFELLGTTYEFSHAVQYHLELDQIETFYELSQNPEKLKAILDQLKEKEDPIPATAIIKELFNPKTPQAPKSNKFERDSKQCKIEKTCFQYEDYKSKKNNKRNFAIMSKNEAHQFQYLRINPFREESPRLKRAREEAIKKGIPLGKADYIGNAIRQAREIHEKIPLGELKKLHERIEAIKDPEQKIIKTAVAFMEWGVMGCHCGSWVMTVYEFAGVYGNKRTVAKYENNNDLLEDKGGNQNPDLLKKGDWIWSHTPGNHTNNHSAIIMGIQKDNEGWVVQTISYPNYNNKTPRIVTLRYTNDTQKLYPKSKDRNGRTYHSIKKISRPT